MNSPRWGELELNIQAEEAEIRLALLDKHRKRWYQEHRRELLAQSRSRRRRHKAELRAEVDKGQQIEGLTAYGIKTTYNVKYIMPYYRKCKIVGKRINFPVGGYEKLYGRMFKQQNGRCKLCGKKTTEVGDGRKHKKAVGLHLDHNHRTGKVRGLLCCRCNTQLVSPIEHIMELSKRELLSMLRYVGIRTILKKIDRVCDSQILELYLSKNRQYPYKSEIRKRNIKLIGWKTGLSIDIGERNRDLLMKDQKDVCKLCGTYERGRRLSVDHSHRTNVVRGLLCSGCNIRIGFIDKILDLSDEHLYDVVKYIGIKRIIKRLSSVIELIEN